MNSFSIVFASLLLFIPDAIGSEGQRKSRAQLEHLVDERNKVIDLLIKRVEALEGQHKKESAVSVKAENASSMLQPVTGKDLPSQQGNKVTIKKNPQAKQDKGSTSGEGGTLGQDDDSAQRALERTLVISGALLVPYGQFEIQPGFSYLRYSAQGSGLSQQGSSISLTSLNSHTDAMLGSAYFRLGLPLDSQLEGYLPYESLGRSVTTSTGTEINSFKSNEVSGLSDVRIGLAKTLLTERDWWPDVIARVTWNSNTGSYPYRSPIGLGYNEMAGSVTVSKRQDPLVFYGNLSYQAPLTSGNRSPGDIFGVTIGTILGASPETSLRFFINQNFISNSKLYGQSTLGTSANISTLNIGASTILGKGFFMDFTTGVGLTKESPDYVVGASFAYRLDMPFLPGIM